MYLVTQKYDPITKERLGNPEVVTELGQRVILTDALSALMYLGHDEFDGSKCFYEQVLEDASFVLGAGLYASIHDCLRFFTGTTGWAFPNGFAFSLEKSPEIVRRALMSEVDEVTTTIRRQEPIVVWMSNTTTEIKPPATLWEKAATKMGPFAEPAGSFLGALVKSATSS